MASRERMRRWFDVEDAERLAIALAQGGTQIDTALEVTVCRDPDNNYLLALAEASDAQYLVTRDNDLPVLKRWKQTRIVPPREFLHVLETT